MKLYYSIHFIVQFNFVVNKIKINAMFFVINKIFSIAFLSTSQSSLRGCPPFGVALHAAGILWRGWV